MKRNIILGLFSIVILGITFFYLNFTFIKIGITLSLFVSVVIALISYLYFTLFLLANRKTRKRKAFVLLNEGFKNDTIQEKSDIDNILNFLNNTAQNDTEKLSLEQFLSDYKIYLRQNNNHQILKEQRDFIQKVINQEKETQPYSNIPDYERRLLLEIEDAMKNNKHFSLINLSNTIADKERKIERAQTINSWSIPLGILGVVFSILSIIAPLIYKLFVD